MPDTALFDELLLMSDANRHFWSLAWRARESGKEALVERFESYAALAHTAQPIALAAEDLALRVQVAEQLGRHQDAARHRDALELLRRTDGGILEAARFTIREYRRSRAHPRRVSADVVERAADLFEDWRECVRRHERLSTLPSLDETQRLGVVVPAQVEGFVAYVQATIAIGKHPPKRTRDMVRGRYTWERYSLPQMAGILYRAVAAQAAGSGQEASLWQAEFEGRVPRAQVEAAALRIAQASVISSWLRTGIEGNPHRSAVAQVANGLDAAVGREINRLTLPAATLAALRWMGTSPGTVPRAQTEQRMLRIADTALATLESQAGPPVDLDEVIANCTGLPSVQDRLPDVMKAIQAGCDGLGRALIFDAAEARNADGTARYVAARDEGVTIVRKAVQVAVGDHVEAFARATGHAAQQGRSQPGAGAHPALDTQTPMPAVPRVDSGAGEGVPSPGGAASAVRKKPGPHLRLHRGY